MIYHKKMDKYICMDNLLINITRSVTILGLEPEILSAQITLNRIILTVNNFLQPDGQYEFQQRIYLLQYKKIAANNF